MMTRINAIPKFISSEQLIATVRQFLAYSFLDGESRLTSKY